MIKLIQKRLRDKLQIRETTERKKLEKQLKNVPVNELGQNFPDLSRFEKGH